MKNVVLAALILLGFTRCETSEKSESKSVSSAPITNDTLNEEALIQNHIELFKVTPVSFPDAILELNTPNESQQFKENENVSFNFNAINFGLTGGQHIALWNKNYAIERLTKADFKRKFSKGNYTSIAFLCDELGISIKQPEAYVMRSFTVGENPFISYTDSSLVVLNINEKVTSSNPIIDFYIANTNISKTGNKVLLSIDQNIFQLHNWSAYTINGLRKGKHKIKIELVNHKGQKFNSPFTSDSTDIILK
jgi:hypothetical protein